MTLNIDLEGHGYTSFLIEGHGYNMVPMVDYTGIHIEINTHDQYFAKCSKLSRPTFDLKP